MVSLLQLMFVPVVLGYPGLGFYGPGHMLGIKNNPYHQRCQLEDGGGGVCTYYGHCLEMTQVYLKVTPCKNNLVCCPYSQPSRHRVCVSPRGEPGRCAFAQNCAHTSGYTPQCNTNEVCCVFSTLRKQLHVANQVRAQTAVELTTESHVTASEVERPLPTKTVHKNRGLLYEKICGFQNDRTIIGGTVTDIYEYPWLTLFEYTYNNGLQQLACGGALISPQYVLTAAHCIPKDKRAKIKEVILGEFDRSTEQDVYYGVTSPPLQVIKVDKIKVHEMYQDSETKGGVNDIALIRLQHNVTITKFVSPVCIPLDELAAKDYAGDEVKVAGWGRTSNLDAKSSDTKQHVGLRLMAPQECAESLPSFNIDYNVVCSMGNRGQDSCRGDSGGPLVKKEQVGNEPTKWYVIGIVSYGRQECGSETADWVSPSVNTRVSQYIDWILDNLEP